MTEQNSCALCNDTNDLTSYDVPPRNESILICGTCRPQVEGAELDPNHWYCLQESAWSEVAAVQVVSWRLLNRLNGESWASDLLDQLYMEDETLAWAKEGLEDHAENDDQPKVIDSNGSQLQDGDSVTIIKDLAVKGAGFTAKRGTLVKNIRLGNDPTHIEGRVNKVAILLKTEFLKKTV